MYHCIASGTVASPLFNKITLHYNIHFFYCVTLNLLLPARCWFLFIPLLNVKATQLTPINIPSQSVQESRQSVILRRCALFDWTRN